MLFTSLSGKIHLYNTVAAKGYSLFAVFYEHLLVIIKLLNSINLFRKARQNTRYASFGPFKKGLSNNYFLIL